MCFSHSLRCPAEGKGIDPEVHTLLGLVSNSVAIRFLNFGRLVPHSSQRSHYGIIAPSCLNINIHMRLTPGVLTRKKKEYKLVRPGYTVELCSPILLPSQRRAFNMKSIVTLSTVFTVVVLALQANAVPSPESKPEPICPPSGHSSINERCIGCKKF